MKPSDLRYARAHSDPLTQALKTASRKYLHEQAMHRWGDGWFLLKGFFLFISGSLFYGLTLSAGSVNTFTLCYV